MAIGGVEMAISQANEVNRAYTPDFQVFLPFLA